MRLLLRFLNTICKKAKDCETQNSANQMILKSEQIFLIHIKKHKQYLKLNQIKTKGLIIPVFYQD